MFWNVPGMRIISSQVSKVAPEKCMMDKQGSMESALLAGFLQADTPSTLLSALTPDKREWPGSSVISPHFRVCSWNHMQCFCLSWKVKNPYDPQTSFIFLLNFWKQNSGDFPQNELCRRYDKMRVHLLLRDSPSKNVIRYSFPDINNC